MLPNYCDWNVNSKAQTSRTSSNFTMCSWWPCSPKSDCASSTWTTASTASSSFLLWNYFSSSTPEAILPLNFLLCCGGAGGFLRNLSGCCLLCLNLKWTWSCTCLSRCPAATNPLPRHHHFEWSRVGSHFVCRCSRLVFPAAQILVLR